MGLTVDSGGMAVILVEGASDQAALEVVAARRGGLGRDVAIVPMGGASNVRRFAARYGPRVVGLCDDAERRDFIRAGITPFVCVADLEDELIRALGLPAVEAVIDSLGEGRRLATFRKQPAHRDRGTDLRRFIATRSGGKLRYARAFAQAVDLARIPAPLTGVLDAALAD
jgi:hypothetical protein